MRSRVRRLFAPRSSSADATHGVGALLRIAAGAVEVLLLWPSVVEPLLGNQDS